MSALLIGFSIGLFTMIYIIYSLIKNGKKNQGLN